MKYTAGLHSLAEIVSGPLEKGTRSTVNALLTLNVHARDVVAQLSRKELQVSDFEWQHLVRYYWERDENVVRCASTRLQYGYEYLGNTSRLVMTPLTDRCYTTLALAIKLCLGGAPAGPAGVGKTESVKDLSKAVGMQCVVISCSDQMDYLMTSKLFKGLAAAGCWCCFD